MKRAPVSRPKAVPRKGKTGARAGQRRTAPTRAGAKAAPKKSANPAPKPRVAARLDAWKDAPPPFRVPVENVAPAPASAKVWPSDGSRPWREPFLKALEELGNVFRACQVVGVARNAVYEFRDEDEEFRKRWKEALDVYVERLEAEADERATRGLLVPVVGRIGDGCDGIIGTERKPSDPLLMFRLKALAPDRYRERREVTGKDGKPLIPERFRSFDLETMTEEELLALRAKLDGLGAAPA
ncbi:MAG TPA: hypothetical protein PK569_21915 [Thermoanaerobaculia bacterium]|nr:hypothetical protein [Thermoanaerobaculia bacterium]